MSKQLELPELIDLTKINDSAILAMLVAVSNKHNEVKK